MKKFSVNEAVRIPVDLQPGAFKDEFLVTFKVDGEVLSGFVKRSYLDISEGQRGFVEAKILEVTRDYITLQIPGSFFTVANGRTSVPSTWANDHLKLAAA